MSDLMIDWAQIEAAAAPATAGHATFETRVREALPGGLVSLAAITDWCQEAGARHATELGMGFYDRLPQDAVWVLGRLRIVMRSYPRLGDSVLVSTWASGLERRSARREFRLGTTAAGVIGVATTSWSLFNLEARRPLGRVADVFARVPSPGPQFLSFAEQRPPSGAAPRSRTDELVPRPADIDVYDHVNNTHLVAWVLGGANPLVAAPFLPEDFDISFRAECRVDDTLQLVADELDRGHVATRLTRAADGIDLVRARARYTPSN